MALNRVVVWDPGGQYADGSLIDEAIERTLAPRGAVALPVMPEAFALAGVGGYTRRSWGSGSPLDGPLPRLSCAVSIYAMPDMRRLWWALRVLPSAEALARLADGLPVSSGHLAFVAAQSRGGQRSATTPDRPPIVAAELGEPDAHGGWTLRGGAGFHPPMEGYYELAVYGACPGLRVAWAAATLVA